MPASEGLISGLADIGVAGINAFSTGLSNRASRKWSERMYQRQFNDSLTLWNMQNAYNDPAQQVKRLQGAGLNPALMYGNGTASAGNADSIGAPNPVRPEFKVPDFGGLAGSLRNSLLLDADLSLKQAQTDNVRANTVAALEQATLTGTRNESLGFDLGVKTELRQTSLEAAQEQLRKLRLDMALSTNKDAREAAANASNLKEAVERIATMQAERLLKPWQLQEIRARINNTNFDAALKREDLKLRKQGIYPSDPLYLRLAANKAQEIMEEVSSKLPYWQRRFSEARAKLGGIFKSNKNSW